MSAVRARRRPRVARLVLCGVVAAGVGASAWYLGMDAAHSAGLGAALFAMIAGLSLLGEAESVEWRADRPLPRAGSRRDVVQLGWSLVPRGGRVSPEGVRRLRLIAAEALSARGIDAAGPSCGSDIERELGPLGSAILARRSVTPTRKQLRGLLLRLESLAASADRSQSEEARRAG